jgi:hypothetical protein
MVVKGLERYGMDDLAREASENHIANMAAVQRDTGTIWENYAPELPEAGNISRKDFVGWSGLGPIAMLIENVIGVRTDALNNTITWHMRNRAERHGLQGLRMAGACIDLLAEDGRVRVKTDAPFTLKLTYGRSTSTHAVPAGESDL